jgi:hypothetical protein
MFRSRRRPYIYSRDEVMHLLETARRDPAPHAPLRPLTLYTNAGSGVLCGITPG